MSANLPPVKLRMFRNGIIVSSLPYYPYMAKEANEILRDIVDGYFPHRLKGKFPEGVRIELLDRTEKLYTFHQDLSPAKPSAKDRFLGNLKDGSMSFTTMMGDEHDEFAAFAEEPHDSERSKVKAGHKRRYGKIDVVTVPTLSAEQLLRGKTGLAR